MLINWIVTFNLLKNGMLLQEKLYDIVLHIYLNVDNLKVLSINNYKSLLL